MAFAMLLVVAAPLFFFIGFTVKQKQIQHAMKDKLESAVLQTIVLNKADVKWFKKNKEIIIDGKLFDIKSYTIDGEKIVFTGLYDHEENKLKKEFANLVHQKKDDAAPLNQLLLKFIFTAAITKNEEPVITFADKNNTPVYINRNEKAVSQFLSVFTPPPNV
ncbi:hypothetical protein [Ferruginibacter sp.]